jgi:saccharopine dehydrogenase-like NADP-dependent oxidoreductase
MNIAILGAPGCVGRTTIKKLLDSSEYKIIASYRTEKGIPRDIQNDRLTWKQVDLLNPASAENFLQGSEILIKS